MKYLPTIGIECHVQLKTKTKLFSAVSNVAVDAKPNSLISHIDVGMPGSLPVLNGAAVELGIRAALALGTTPQKFSKFDRKHYFYPDLPKGYQITQFDQPIISGGFVDINLEGKKHRVDLTRAHLEEDAGKNTHPTGASHSLVDLNRAGTPLLEIVSEPDMHSSAEAKAYAKELYLLMRYAAVSDADLFHGNMRFDVNISLSQDPKKLGTRAEIKNLNSFKSVASAVEYEIHRQTELLESGKKVDQETRGWDEAKQKTVSQRGKEQAHDYRYMPEPDIPPVIIDSKSVDRVKKTMPPLPWELRDKFAQLDIDPSGVETLVDEIITGHFMLEVTEQASAAVARFVANWLVGEGQALMRSGDLTWEKAKLEPTGFIDLAHMVDAGKVSATAAKKIVKQLLIEGGDAATIAKENNLLQMSDNSELSVAVEAVIKENPKAAADVSGGEAKAIGFLVGQVMKKTKGQANPGLAAKLLNERLIK